MTMGEAKKLAKDCRECAEVYGRSPGLAGPGANAGTIIDIYLALAKLADAFGENGDGK